MIAPGVGHNPDSLPPVRRSGVGSGYNSPARIKPQRGKVRNDSVPSSNNKHWAVLNECVAGSYFAKDPGELAPQAAPLALEPVSPPGATDVLAGKPARYDVNNSAPRSAVKGSHVIPDGKRFQEPVVLSLHKYACAVGVDLNRADRSPSKERASENAAPGACEEREFSKLSMRADEISHDIARSFFCAGGEEVEAGGILLDETEA